MNNWSTYHEAATVLALLEVTATRQQDVNGDVSDQLQHAVAQAHKVFNAAVERVTEAGES